MEDQRPAPDHQSRPEPGQHPGPDGLPRAPALTDTAAPSPEGSVRNRMLVLLPTAVGVAALATAASASLGRLDSALFFVGVPVLLALVVGLVPSRTSAGMLFQVVTVTLLMVSAFLHEGALCVLIVSPLLYGSAYFVWWILHTADQVRQRLAVVPLLAVAALEGVVPGARILPTATATAEQVAPGTCAEFVAGLDRPTFSPTDRGWLLRLAQYPTPRAATGDGLAVGDTWRLAMPAGAITTRVAARSGDEQAGRLAFAVVADSARTTRWVTLRRAEVTWEQTGTGCRTRLSIDYRRDLDPAFYFGPITDLFMTAGARAFLAGLG